MPRRIGAALLIGTLLLGACAIGRPASRAAGASLHVVAAENFWGSITAQLAGDRADVTSIITNPATDPHDYEPTPEDAREIASADYVIVNGIGYDAWARKLLDADPSSARAVLDVGKLVGVKAGGNPHQWYSPGSVERFVVRVASDLARLDPANAGYFARRRSAYEKTGLAAYNAIDRADHGSGSQEHRSAARRALSCRSSPRSGSRLETPSSYLDAIAEGNEPTAHDTAIGQPADRAEADQGVHLQPSERDAGCRAARRCCARSRVSRSPSRDRDDGAEWHHVPGSGNRPSCAICATRSRERLRAASRDRVRANHRAPRRRGRDRRPHRLARRRSRGRGRRVRRGPRAERCREVDPAQGAARSAAADRGRDPGPRPARGRRRSRHRVSAPAPQLRSRVCGSAASTSCGWASTATDSGVPLPWRTQRRRELQRRIDELIELVGATAYARRPDRRVLRW